MEKKIERGITWDEVDERTKEAYLDILASLAYVDGNFDMKERQFLVELLEKVGIPDDKRTNILKKFIEKPDMEEVRRKIKYFSDSPLKFSLLSDLILMEKADGRVDPKEHEFVSYVIEQLNFTQKQLGAIIIYLNKMEELKREMDEEVKKEKMNKILAPLITIGIPVLLSATMGWGLGILSFSAWVGYSGISALKLVNSGKDEKDLISKI